MKEEREGKGLGEEEGEKEGRGFGERREGSVREEGGEGRKEERG